jgi:hypothetical protein
MTRRSSQNGFARPGGFRHLHPDLIVWGGVAHRPVVTEDVATVQGQ